MVRKGFLDNPSAPTGSRGDDDYVRVSWDEAYKLIHEQQTRIRKENDLNLYLRALTVGVRVCTA